ncbi:hypothetical protein T484DRAFT_1755000 [Baffinella frigidus]|nr:hypothetical protein T484DRAFT_1755000 [Cryptophyta sp. CCMP2293]
MHLESEASDEDTRQTIRNTCQDLLLKIETVRMSVLHLQYCMHAGALYIDGANTSATTNTSATNNNNNNNNNTTTRDRLQNIWGWEHSGVFANNGVEELQLPVHTVKQQPDATPQQESTIKTNILDVFEGVYDVFDGGSAATEYDVQSLVAGSIGSGYGGVSAGASAGGSCGSATSCAFVDTTDTTTDTTTTDTTTTDTTNHPATGGKLVSVHNTSIATHGNVADATQANMTLNMENICGSFRGFFENVPSAGALLRPGAPRVGKYVQHRQFIGTHHLFHTLHGRLAYRVNQKTWSFKSCRSIQDLVEFVRNLTQDNESPIYPVINMLSVTLRTDTSIVIDPAHSLLQRVLERLYSHVVRMQARVDDTNNLFFMDVVNWKELLLVVEKHASSTGATAPQHQVDTDVQHVRNYLAMHNNDPAAVPTASIGYTRKGIFFVRITFPRGCVCCVQGSTGFAEGVPMDAPPNVCDGGIEPFVRVVVHFILTVLVKMRIVGSL